MRENRILVCAAIGLALLAASAATAASPFATAMNRVCHAANLRVANVGVSESLYELAANEPRLLAADQWEVTRLVRLGKAPRALAAPFAKYLSLQRRIDGLESQMLSAAKHVHLSTVETDQAQVGLLQKKQDAAARKLGAPACLSTAP
jgi:hypothetical protein